MDHTEVAALRKRLHEARKEQSARFAAMRQWLDEHPDGDLADWECSELVVTIDEPAHAFTADPSLSQVAEEIARFARSSRTKLVLRSRSPFTLGPHGPRMNEVGSLQMEMCVRAGMAFVEQIQD